MTLQKRYSVRIFFRKIVSIFQRGIYIQNIKKKKDNYYYFQTGTLLIKTERHDSLNEWETDTTNEWKHSQFERMEWFSKETSKVVVINLVYRDAYRDSANIPRYRGVLLSADRRRKIVASRPPIPVIAAKTNNRGTRPPIRSDSIRSDRSIDRSNTPNPRVGCCLLTALSWVDFDRGAGEASIKSKENLSRFPRLPPP